MHSNFNDLKTKTNDTNVVGRSEQFYCECEHNGGKRCVTECKCCNDLPKVFWNPVIVRAPREYIAYRRRTNVIELK